MTWQEWAFLYVGICAGWGIKEGWDPDKSILDALGSGLLFLLYSPFVPFILVWHWWSERRAKRKAFYAPVGGYKVYRRELKIGRRNGLTHDQVVARLRGDDEPPTA